MRSRATDSLARLSGRLLAAVVVFVAFQPHAGNSGGNGDLSFDMKTVDGRLTILFDKPAPFAFAIAENDKSVWGRKPSGKLLVVCVSQWSPSDLYLAKRSYDAVVRINDTDKNGTKMRLGIRPFRSQSDIGNLFSPQREFILTPIFFVIDNGKIVAEREGGIIGRSDSERIDNLIKWITATPK